MTSDEGIKKIHGLNHMEVIVFPRYSMVGMLVPLKGGIGGIVHPPIGRKNATYIPLIVLAFWGVKNATYHLLGEPEKTIEI